MKRQARAPDIRTENPDAATGETGPRRCAADGCPLEGIYPAPRSRDALRDYLWFCLDHVRTYNKAWNYYDGLHGAALEAEIRRATTWERPSWKFATGQLSDGAFTDPLGLFDFDKRDPSKPGRLLSAEERAAWDTLKLAPVDDLDIVKKQYKQLVKENHPDKNGGDAGAEERLKEINLAFSLIRKSLTKGGKPAAV